MGIAGVHYDPGGGIIEVAFRFASTVIPMVLNGFEFWLLLFFNVGVSACKHLHFIDPAEYHVDLPWGLTGVTGSLMTFFVCFYNQHVFGRYNKLYNLTNKMTESCLELVSVLRVQVPCKSAQRRIAKLIIASSFMFFFERTEGDDSIAISSREFKQMKGLGLLGDHEIAHLKHHCERYEGEAMPSFLVLQWAMQMMRKETPNPEERDDMLVGFYDRIFRVRTCQAEVCQMLDLPMPFQYFHIMNLMLILNLVLWSYSLGCEDSYWSPLIYMFVQMMFQGIRELSTALSDPFGDDEVDFPVTQWMIAVYARMYGVLEDPFDIMQSDLSKVTPFMDPWEVKTNKMIDVYVDLSADDDAPMDISCDFFGCGGSGDNPKMNKGEEFIPRGSGSDSPLLNSDEESE